MTQKNNEGENLSRIREILFGEDLQGIEKQFSLFKDDSTKAFEQLKKEFEERFIKLEKLLTEKGDKVDKQQEKSVEAQKVVNIVLRKNLSDINQDVVKEKERIEKVIVDAKDSLEKKTEKLEDQLKTMIEKILEENNSKYNELSNSKINKKDLAVIFTGLSEQLKQ